MWSREHKTTTAGGDIAQFDGTVLREALVQVIGVVAFRCAGAHQVEVLGAEPGDRKLRTDAAAARKGVAQRHAPELDRDLVGHDGVQPGFRASTGYFVLGERSQVDDPDPPAQPPTLVAHMLEIVRAAETPLIARIDTGWREPVGTLPAITLAEHGTHAHELVVHRARLQRPRVRSLLIRKVDRED